MDLPQTCFTDHMQKSVPSGCLFQTSVILDLFAASYVSPTSVVSRLQVRGGLWGLTAS